MFNASLFFESAFLLFLLIYLYSCMAKN